MVLTIETGLPLDTMIAERIFGETVVPDEVNFRGVALGQPGSQGRDLPHYSTDIAAAWTVVERCAAIGPFAYRQVNGLPVATWFMAHFEAAHLWAHTSKEAAEEICRAALRAIEGQRVVN